jgi:hypothetical protein
MTKGEGIDFCGSLYGSPMTSNSNSWTHCVAGVSQMDVDVSRSPLSTLPFERSGRRILNSDLVRRFLALVAAFVIVLSVGGRTAQAATVRWVDLAATSSPPGTGCGTSAGYNSIVSAVAAASAGDTIQVCAGLYNEQVQIDKTLTLLGAKAGVDARTRSVANESIINNACGPVQIIADNVVINGFTIQGSTLPDPCFLAGIWTNPGFSGTNGGHQILNNIVQNNISGIELDSTCVFSTLAQFNLIQNNNNPGPGSGNAIQTNFGLCNATVDNNKFSGHTNSSFLVVAPSSGLTVSNNELVAGTSERIVFGTVSTSTISNNVSTGSTSSGTIRLFGGDSNVTITSNTLLNGMRGIRVDDPFAIGINSGVTAHSNCIKGNTMAGLEVGSSGHSGILHAENNWWGSSTGPTNANNPGGTGDAVVDPDNNVTFVPFLTSPPGPPCPAAPPPPNTPGKVTGGGQIPGDDPIFSPTGDLLSLPALTLSAVSASNPNGRATFGFVAKCCAPSGNLDYDDHPAGVRIKAQSVDSLVISSPGSSCPATPGSKLAKFGGAASVIRSNATTTEPYTVDVDDCDEPGTADTFGIKTTTYSNGPSTLIGGNIQIHQ